MDWQATLNEWIWPPHPIDEWWEAASNSDKFMVIVAVGIVVIAAFYLYEEWKEWSGRGR